MKDKENLIIDYVFGELPENQKHIAEKLIATDENCARIFKALTEVNSELHESVYRKVSDERLDAARERLFASLPSVKKTAVSSNYWRFGRELLKYVAVVTVTFFSVNYYNNRSMNSPDQPVGIPINAGNQLAQEASFVPGGDNLKVSNLDISREGDELVMAFDVSTSKVIRGTKDDPAVVYALDQLMKSSADPAVKLRTLKYVEKTRDPKFQKSLLALIKSDKDLNVRRKALKILGNAKIDEETKNVLLELVAGDSDQVMRIEALNILETYDLAAGEAAVKNLHNDDDELLRFKAGQLKSN